MSCKLYIAVQYMEDSMDKTKNFLGLTKGSDGRMRIDLNDPTFTRSDRVIYNRADSSLHAVLEGTSHHVGFIDRTDAANMNKNDEVVLSAPHYHSGTVNLTSRLSVH
jgi:hypothetical protein